MPSEERGRVASCCRHAASHSPHHTLLLVLRKRAAKSGVRRRDMAPEVAAKLVSERTASCSSTHARRFLSHVLTRPWLRRLQGEANLLYATQRHHEVWEDSRERGRVCM